MGVILNELGRYKLQRDAVHAIPAANLLANTMIQVAHGYSTVHAEMDFETYSEAGLIFDYEKGRFKGIMSGGKKGIKAVGASVYAQHPSTEVMCLAYNLKDGLGPRLWTAGDPLPWDLFAYIQSGKLIEAHNSGFEYSIWHYVCHLRMGWPPLSHMQLRCSMSKACAFSLPASLDKLSEAIDSPIKKDKVGSALMLKLAQPRTPTKGNASLRYTPRSHPTEFKRLGQYCINDTIAESEVSAMLPDLQPDELKLWLLDQQINIRGVHIDRASLENCIDIVKQAFDKYSEELRSICGGYTDTMGQWHWNVESPAELDNIKAYLAAKGVRTDSLDAEHLAELLARSDLPPDCRRVLEIRDMLSAASVKKLFSLLNYLGEADRVRGLFTFCGASGTGRFAGGGPQPQNMPSSGPKLNQCDPINGCGHYFQNKLNACPWCHASAEYSAAKQDWSPEAVDQALKVIASRRLDYVEHYFGDAIETISGCLRGLFTAAPGKDFICSDFSAIEAVVLAELAGEKWRQDVFHTHGKIYEMSAAKISGIPFEDFMKVAGYVDLTKEKWWEEEVVGKHHALRKTVGKVAELACFAANTQVLTDGGFKRITDITKDDKLWDGFHWVNHGGVVPKGGRHVVNLDGVAVTSEHPIAIGDDHWKTVSALKKDKELKRRAYKYVRENHLPPTTFALPDMPLAKAEVVAVYDILNAGPNHRFTIATRRGLLLVHNSGYQGWIGAWKNFGADKFMDDEEIKKAILAWRDASPAIVELWGGQYRRLPGRKWDFEPEFYGLEGAAVQAIMNPGQAYQYRLLTYLVHDDVMYCRLPSGRMLSYHQPRLTQGMNKLKQLVWQISYMGVDSKTKRWVRTGTYGGSLVENCLAGGTLVLTDSGWKRLDEIEITDLVHDGVEFVNHSGILYKSVKPCVSIDGVLMTNDHKVLTNYGWKAASQRPRPYRPSIRNAHLYGIKSFGWKEKSLALPMRVWEQLREGWLRTSKRCETWWHSKLWMFYSAFDSERTITSWYEQTSSLCDMALNDGPMPPSNTSSLAQLWGSWDKSVCSLARVLREFLGGCWPNISKRARARSSRQQRRLFSGELSVGNSAEKREQSTWQCNGSNHLRPYDSKGHQGSVWNKSHDDSLPNAKQLADRRHAADTGFKESKGYPVYDILNCGPRSRFVVKGDNGPFIVHNCCQAVARDILTFSMKNLEAAGYHIVLHIHDEIVAEVDKDFGSIEEFERIMAIMPEWAKGWPIKAAGGWRGLRYRKG